MESRPNNTHQKDPAVSSISLNKPSLEKPAKNHFFEECREKQEKKPRIRKCEIRTESWRIHVSKVVCCPFRPVKQILPSRKEQTEPYWNCQRKASVRWLWKPGRVPYHLPVLFTREPEYDPKDKKCFYDGRKSWEPIALNVSGYVRRKVYWKA